MKRVTPVLNLCRRQLRGSALQAEEGDKFRFCAMEVYSKLLPTSSLPQMD
jgi:hypothetical protein